MGPPPGLPATLGVEGKTTTDADSIFNYVPSPITTNSNGESMLTGRVRLCRVGTEFLLLHRMSESATEWSIVSPFAGNDNPGPFTRADISHEIDVGIMTNIMFGLNYGPLPEEDLFTARFDYVRFGSVHSLDDCFGGIVVE